VAAADILGSRILEVNDRIITRLSLLERAADIAKHAAPYVHPAWRKYWKKRPVDVKVTMTLKPDEAYIIWG
jgi:hypothetical protein